MSQCDRAIAAYRRYTDLVPDKSDPYYGLGLCLRRPATARARSRRSSTTSRSTSARNRSGWVENARGILVELGELQRRLPAGRVRRKPQPPPTASRRRQAGRPSRPARRADWQPVRRGTGAARSRPHRRGDREVPAGDRRRSEAHAAARAALGELLLKIRRDDEAIEVLRAARRQEPLLPAGAGTIWRSRCAFADRPAEAVDAYRALHQAAVRTIPTPTTASGVRCSTWAARPTRARRTRPTSRWRSARASSAGSNRPQAQLRTLVARRSSARRAAAQETGVSSGSSSVNVEPWPGLLSTDSVPPWATAICRPI